MEKYQETIHNIYYDGNIKTDHRVILLMPEDVAKHFSLPKFTCPVAWTLREIFDNDITTRDKFSLNCLGMEKGKSGGLFMVLKTVMEVAQDYTFLNCVSPIP